jgi:hypothetical protein
MEEQYIENFKNIYLNHIDSHIFLIDDEKDIQMVEKLKEALINTKFSPTNANLFNSIINKYNKIIEKWT